jgi:hypothetical protein
VGNTADGFKIYLELSEEAEKNWETIYGLV